MNYVISNSGKLLRVNSGAREVLYFEAPRGTRQTVTAAELEKIDWHTHSCVLGKECEGIWPLRSDVTDINAADVNKSRSLIATADDFGYVNLFSYPAEVRQDAIILTQTYVDEIAHYSLP